VFSNIYMSSKNGLIESEKPWNKLEKALIHNNKKSNVIRRTRSVAPKISLARIKQKLEEERLQKLKEKQIGNRKLVIVRRGNDIAAKQSKPEPSNKYKIESHVKFVVRRATPANPPTKNPTRTITHRISSTKVTKMNVLKAGQPSIVRKALLVGINYTGTSSELNGCINDCEDLKTMLIKNKYFNDTDIILMSDNRSGLMYPTKINILAQLDALLSFAKKNADKQVQLFFSYSGHGSQTKDTNGDEADGQDEVLCPIDCLNDANKLITDDDIKANFLSRLPSNVKLVSVIDACHSATMLDLRYMYNVDSKITYTVIGTETETASNIVMVSGCRDNETSADAVINRRPRGALTASFLANYKPGISYNDLINGIRTWLKTKGFQQVPQLSTGKHVEINAPFLLGSYGF